MQALFDSATGRLISLGDTIPIVPPGTASTNVGAVDLSAVMWDAPTRAFVARPAKVRVDRVEEWLSAILADATFASAYGTLTTARKNNIQTGLRNVLTTMLANQRYRAASEGTPLA